MISPNFVLLEDWAAPITFPFASRQDLVAHIKVRELYEGIIERHKPESGTLLKVEAGAGGSRRIHRRQRSLDADDEATAQGNRGSLPQAD